MVKFQIASDLHIEYKNDNVDTKFSKYIDPKADILILAGDIGSLYKIDQLKNFLNLACSRFMYVLYVPGNHEYYRVPHGVPEVPMHILHTRLLELDNMFSNLYVLNRTSVCIDDVCIAGCTLWSESKTNIPWYIVRIQGMNKEKYNKMHRKDLKFVMKTIDYCRNNKKKLLMVTHHVPTYKIMKGKKAKDKFISLYGSNLDYLLRHDYVHTWVCGHIHRNFDFITSMGSRLVGNQYGKEKDNITDYKKNMTIEV